jgi:hypothetical protein
MESSFVGDLPTSACQNKPIAAREVVIFVTGRVSGRKDGKGRKPVPRLPSSLACGDDRLETQPIHARRLRERDEQTCPDLERITADAARCDVPRR